MKMSVYFSQIMRERERKRNKMCVCVSVPNFYQLKQKGMC